MSNREFIKEVGFGRFVLRKAIRQFNKRVLQRSQRMLLPTGEWMTLPLTSQFATEAYITGANVDWGSEALFASMIRGTGAFLDVGANIGYYSLYMAPKVPAVYSFEPDPRARHLLEANVWHNRKIAVIPCAVGLRPGRMAFAMANSSETSRLRGAKEQPTGTEIQVEVVSVDTFVLERGIQVEGIKIDAEGHDFEVIEGSERVLRDQQPLVLSEVTQSDALFDLLNHLNYRVFAFVRDHQTRDLTFQELNKGVNRKGVTKMLFLVPRHLTDGFDALRRSGQLPSS